MEDSLRSKEETEKELAQQYEANEKQLDQILALENEVSTLKERIITLEHFQIEAKELRDQLEEVRMRMLHSLTTERERERETFRMV